MSQTRKKVGLALGSGAVRGVAHIGVLKALVKNNIPIDFIAGSSIGAWIGAHYALYQDLEKLERETIGNKREKLAAFLDPTLRGGIVSGERMAKLLRKYLHDNTFADCRIPLQIVATDLVSGEPVVFSKGEIVPAVCASAAVPSVFKPIVIDNRVLVDGGISNPVPDDVVKAMGADVVISISLDSFNQNGTFSQEDLGLTRVVTRTLDIMRYHLAQYSLKNSDVVIKPHLPLFGIKGWTKFFTEEMGEKLVKVGEVETEKQILEIKRLLNS